MAKHNSFLEYSIEIKIYLKEILTVHVDVLAQFNQLHFCWHVAHSPHQVPQVFAADVAVFIFIELQEGFTQLYGQTRKQMYLFKYDDDI